MVFVNSLLVSLLVSSTILAAPTDSDIFPEGDAHLGPRASAITTMTTAQVNTFTPYTYYAAAGYCNPSVTKTWTCGANCNANPKFIPIASGGDGSDTQFWYVGYDPTLQTIIVVHQGTAASKIIPILTDVDLFLDGLDSTLFPGVPSSVKVHNGFRDAQARAANDVLSAVTTGINTYGTKSVVVVGHSLGGAISLLDAIFLPLHISGLTVSFYGYGLPRVGNKDFANYVDNQLDGRFTRITNLKDPVPIIPGRFLGFRHPSGEAHIDNGEIWKWCPGQDNTDAQCSIGDTPNIFVSDSNEHDGPYNGIIIKC